MSNKRLIFAGFDKTGKTTLAKSYAELAEMEKIPYFCDPSYKGGTFGEWDTIEYTTDQLIYFMEETFTRKSGQILDRFVAPCEYAYSNGFREGMEFVDMVAFDARLSALDFKIVYCYKREFGELLQETPFTSEDATMVDRFYRQYFELTMMPVLILDTTNEDMDDQLRSIKVFAHGSQNN